jgi:hypothetical protein
MKAKLLALVSLASLFVLNGCNGIGDKDTLLARIDGEKVYQEDFALLLKNEGGQLKTFKNQYLYDNLYSTAALSAKAVEEYPELETEWKNYYADLDVRVLTMVFQRYYVSENMTYSDAELRQFYDANRSMFPEDSTGDFYTVRPLVASCYYAFKNADAFASYIKDTLKLETPTAEDSLKAKKSFAAIRRSALQEELSTGILDKYKIGIQEIPLVDPKAFYNRHQDLFMTAPGYELYHVQADSAKLTTLLAATPTLEQFKSMAVANSKNAKTAKDSGYVGHVKKDFALPYGIGVIPDLAKTLDGKEAGFVTPVLKSSDNVFHIFYLAGVDVARLKPYDRVDAGIVSGLKDGSYFDVDTSVVLITRAGEPVFTEADMVRFNERFVRRVMTRPLHDRIVSMLAENFAFAEAAKEAHLNHSWEYRALVRQSRRDYLSEHYVLKKINGENIPEDTLKALYDQVGSPIHEGYDYEKAKDDLRKVSAFPENMYKYEYYMGYRVLYKGLSYVESKPKIYYRRSEEVQKLFTERLAAEAYSKATVHLYDTGVTEYKPTMIANILLARADSLYQAGKKSAAYYEYRKLMYAYAENDSLFERALYEMAQIESENEEFLDADGDYYAFYTMWPNSANAEKAMFSRGFMLNENLGQNDKALEVLEAFLQKYPNSELKESAQWLVDNIKSDGKLAEDLMKKIEAEE